MLVQYKIVEQDLKEQIIQGEYEEGGLLPSEHVLAKQYGINRATVRRALDELTKQGYIYRHQGKGSIVKPQRRRTLGILNIKGFSDAARELQKEARTEFIVPPKAKAWPTGFFFPLQPEVTTAQCIFFERVRYMDAVPFMIESTYLPHINVVRNILEKPFVNDSLFDTLRMMNKVEINHAEQHIKAIECPENMAMTLGVKQFSPILELQLKFSTTNPQLFIYSSLYCNTQNFYISNLF